MYSTGRSYAAPEEQDERSTSSSPLLSWALGLRGTSIGRGLCGRRGCHRVGSVGANTGESRPLRADTSGCRRPDAGSCWSDRERCRLYGLIS